MSTDLKRLKALSTSGELTKDDLNWTVTYSGSIAGASAELHSTSLHHMISRNSPGGINWVFLAQMCVAAAYDYWEDHYRDSLANSLGVSKNDLVDDVFGELGNLRHAIVHNGARATLRVSLNKSLPRFDQGDVLSLSPQQVHDTLDAVKSSAKRVVSALANSQPHLAASRPPPT